MPFISRCLCVLLTIFLAGSQTLTAQIQQRLSAELSSGTSTKRLDLPVAGLQALTATWALDEHPDKLEYRTVNSNHRFSEWQSWSLQNEAGMPAAALLMLPGTIRSVEVRSTSIGNLHINALSYSPSKLARKAQSSLANRSCNCPSPAIVSRTIWCPDGSCAPKAIATPVQAKHIVIHHSAQALGKLDYALAVRAIYDYHTSVNGWDDIGYNLIIAPDGTVFEGRGVASQGAHFCGANAETLGVCLLGDFETEEVQRESSASLTRVSTYLGCAFDIDPALSTYHAPSGKTLAGVVGHREGCATACPGEKLAALLPQLQAEVGNRLNRGCTALPVPQNLTVSASANGEAKLSWVALPQASSFIIERSTGSLSDYKVLAEVSTSTVSFTDLQTLSGSNYYRIRARIDGFLSDYSNEVIFNASPNAIAAVGKVPKPKLANNPSGGALQVLGLKYKVDQAFVSDQGGRTVLELSSGEPSWTINDTRLAQGQYWLVLFSGNEWFTVPFEFRAS